MTGYSIEVDRSNLRHRTTAALAPEPAPGQAVARIDGFALTSNNVTYAAFGEMMGYWRFFPASDPARGIIPVWGFGTIERSRAGSLREGDRFYGYWPSATHALLEPGDVKAHGFSDQSPHRQGLAPIYNAYVPARPGQDEARTSLFRPLFATGFLLDATVGSAGGAVVATSASSKTALSMASALKTRGVGTVGLTSAANLPFVERTGLWSRVLTYDDLGELAGVGRATLVDFAGNPRLIAAIHAALPELTASWTVGATEWDADRDVDPALLTGPKPQLFFAPNAWADAAAGEGPAAFEARLTNALNAFITDSQHWLHVSESQGAAAYTTALDALLDNRADPSSGYYLKP